MKIQLTFGIGLDGIVVCVTDAPEREMFTSSNFSKPATSVEGKYYPNTPFNSVLIDSDDLINAINELVSNVLSDRNNQQELKVKE